MFGFGASVERGLSDHLSLDSALTFAVSGDAAADHVDDGASKSPDKKGVEVVDHGCHGCAAIPQPLPHGAATPVVFGERLAWTAVPSADGRKPHIDLPPPRA